MHSSALLLCQVVLKCAFLVRVCAVLKRADWESKQG